MGEPSRRRKIDSRNSEKKKEEGSVYRDGKHRFAFDFEFSVPAPAPIKGSKGTFAHLKGHKKDPFCYIGELDMFLKKE